MPLKLSFSKVNVLSFSRKPEGGTVKVRCAPTKTVAKALDWDDVPAWQKSACPVGQLAASLVEFIPRNDDQAKSAIELSTTAVRDFEFVRVQQKTGKKAQKTPVFRLELHCALDFNDVAGAKKLEAYMQSVGESTMRVTYEKQAEQSAMDLGEPEEEGDDADSD